MTETGKDKKNGRKGNKEEMKRSKNNLIQSERRREWERNEEKCEVRIE